MFAARTVASVARICTAFVAAIVIASSAALGDPDSVRAQPPFGSTDAWFRLGAQLSAPALPYLRALGSTSTSISYGSDGRLTILLLGSDTRAGGIGRTDTIMIMSLKGNQISAASIPRDSARIPKPGGGYYKGRVNTLARQMGLPAFADLIGRVLQIQIDYYALVSFGGFDRLVDVVDPITVNNPRTIKDSRFWDDPTKKSGVYFPALSSYTLNAWPNGPLCNGLYRNYTNPPLSTACHRALPYVRTRKADSDFARARRQQTFVSAVIRKVTGGSYLSALVSAATGQAVAGTLRTSIPINLTTASEFYNALNGASVTHQVVFQPKTYAAHIPGTTAYQLKLSAVRAWTAAYMR